jgi:hypothetical protein
MASIDALRWAFPHRAGQLSDVEEFDPISIRGDGATPVWSLLATCTSFKGIRPRRISNIIDENGERIEDEDEDEGVEDEGSLFKLTAVGANPQRLLFDNDQETQTVEYPVWRGAGFRFPPVVKPRIRSEFLAPYAHRVQPFQLRSLSRAVIEDEKSSVVELLRDLDPDILDVEIITNKEGSRPLLALKHRRAGVAPLSVFGDGLRRAFMIAMAIQENRNGLLLIDEIEAALHVTALGKLFPWLMRSCERYGVQLFASTHSLEAIDVIARAARHASEDELVAYHLNAQSERIPPKRYSSGMLNRLVHERGLDIR